MYVCVVYLPPPPPPPSTQNTVGVGGPRCFLLCCREFLRARGGGRAPIRGMHFGEKSDKRRRKNPTHPSRPKLALLVHHECRACAGAGLSRRTAEEGKRQEERRTLGARAGRLFFFFTHGPRRKRHVELKGTDGRSL